jgi:uncharacterized protein YigE (DUF2233 family)
LILLLAACGLTQPAPAPPPPTRAVPTLFPTSASAAQADPAPDTGWMIGSSGIELRRMQATTTPGQSPSAVTVARIDPAQVRLRVLYAPDKPRMLRSWFADTRPLIAINGGFFDQAYNATALLISDSAISGASYAGFGGMLSVAPGGDVSIRPLRDQPYDPGEELVQALQSFPMLVFPGGTTASLEDDGQRARRSAVALDRAGRLLLIASPTSRLTLHDFAGWLAESDLEIDRALNLDGGSSTGMFVSDGDLREEIDSFGPLPIVLLVEAK